MMHLKRASCSDNENHDRISRILSLKGSLIQLIYGHGLKWILYQWLSGKFPCILHEPQSYNITGIVSVHAMYTQTRIGLGIKNTTIL